MREKEGNNLHHVIKAAKPADEKVFKLKLKGAIPELQTKKADPTMVVKNTDGADRR